MQPGEVGGGVDGRRGAGEQAEVGGVGFEFVEDFAGDGFVDAVAGFGFAVGGEADVEVFGHFFLGEAVFGVGIAGGAFIAEADRVEAGLFTGHMTTILDRNSVLHNRF